jgi:hypothetical protein
METGSGLIRTKASESIRRWAAAGCLLLTAALFSFGCGAPGEPTPPAPPIPSTVTDLSAHQRGDSVLLAFTLPRKSITGDRLAETPAIEVLRGTATEDGTPDAKSLHVVETIPGELVAKDLKEERVEVTDPISPEEAKTHPGMRAAYEVRTRVSKKRASANSNVVVLRLYPVAERISTLQARVTETNIELSWAAPLKTSGGDPLTSPVTYRVYRGEIDPASAEAATKDTADAKWRVKPVLLGPTDDTSYRDSGFDFGKTYVYLIRSAVSVADQATESSDSVPAVVMPLDTFPPTAPRGVVAAALPGATVGSAQVDLSWSINIESDLAGYRVYRSEQEGTRGSSITPELLLTPAVRDNSVQPGHRYWYTVTAVDHAGNESAAGQQVAVEIAQPSP